MNQLIILLSLIAYSSCVSPEVESRPSEEVDILPLPAGYQFSYSTGNEGPAQMFREEKRQDDGTVIGKYGYVDPNGQLRVVQYRADKNSGFSVSGDTGPDEASMKIAANSYQNDLAFKQQKQTWEKMQRWYSNIGWGNAWNPYNYNPGSVGSTNGSPGEGGPSRPTLPERQINWNDWDHNRNWNNYNSGNNGQNSGFNTGFNSGYSSGSSYGSSSGFSSGYNNQQATNWNNQPNDGNWGNNINYNQNQPALPTPGPFPPVPGVPAAANIPLNNAVFKNSNNNQGFSLAINHGNSRSSINNANNYPSSAPAPVNYDDGNDNYRGDNNYGNNNYGGNNYENNNNGNSNNAGNNNLGNNNNYYSNVQGWPEIPKPGGNPLSGAPYTFFSMINHGDKSGTSSKYQYSY